MSLANLLKSTGGIVSSARNQYADIERMFQGYTQNPYITQQSEMYDNAYYPGYTLNNANGYGSKYGSSAPGSYGNMDTHHGYGTQHYPPPHETYPDVHSYSGGHGHSQPRHKSKGNSSAMSTLTLLAFLFFLNILQSCLKEHMMAMNPTLKLKTPPIQIQRKVSFVISVWSKVMVMTAGVSRNRGSQRTSNDQDDVELKDSKSDFSITTAGDDIEFENDSKISDYDYNYRKFFNESDIKFQNANNYYKRKPHKP